MRKLIAAVSMAGLMMTALPAMAQTTTSVPPNIQALLDQIKALQEQLRKLQDEKQEAIAKLVATLKEGAEGDAVKILQAALAADPDIYPEGRITGYYGALTRAAVKRFQKKHGLEQVGNVGPKTLEKINQILNSNPVQIESSTTGTSTTGGRPCAIVPPGHLIAPGWLRKQDGVKPVVPPCQTIPPGILKKLQGTPPAATTTDTTAPIISNVSATNITSSSAVVAWTTNEGATSQVMYGTTTALGNATNLDSALVISHSQTVSGLTASTTYYYAVQSKDAAGNTASSSQQSFTTTQ